MRKNETKFGQYFELPNPGLRAYLDHVVEGQPDVYRTPFYKGRDVQDLLKEWDKKLCKIQDEFPDLYNFEKDLGKKVGPLSVMKPLSERMDDIDAYYDLISLDQTPIQERAIESALKEWSDVAGIRMRNQSNTLLAMKKSTNSGSPYFVKRRTVVNKTLPVSVTYCPKPGEPSDIDMLQGEALNNWKATAVLGWRGQEGGPNPEDVKQRVVWMFPFAVNIAELQVYQPLIAAMQKSKNPHIPAWVSMECVDKAITRMFDTKDPDDLVICTDFSKFDQHFNETMQDGASRAIRYLFGETGDEAAPISKWMRNVFPIKYCIPLTYNWGCIRTGRHGMGSGSGGTNADETLAHRMLQHEVALMHNQVLNPNSQCLGDDGVLTYPGITVEDVVSAYSSHGQEANPDKQYASKHDCVYLRRWHGANYRIDNVCVGVYSTNRALGRLAEQERFYDPEIWSKEMVILRYLSILENIKYHPLKEEFVDWCIKGDKYRLGLDIPGFFDKIQIMAAKAIDQMPDFLGYTRTLEGGSSDDMGKNGYGINDWWVVNYLKSKA